jgi:hypothetical protein
VKSASKSPKRSAKSAKSSAAMAKKSAIAGTAIKMMQENEIRRQVQIEKEQELTIEVLGKFRQNPNMEMHKVQKDLERINQRLDPIMNQVDQQLTNVGFTQRLKDQANSIGMISKIAGRYISFYSDDLAELLLDDILEETVYEMQNIENQTKKTYLNNQQQVMAQEMMNMLIDYQNDEEVVLRKTEEMLKNIPSQKAKKKPYGTQPTRAIMFDVDHTEIDEIHDSKEVFTKGYSNPFTSAIERAYDEDGYDDDFEEESKESLRKQGTKSGQPKKLPQKKFRRNHEESLDQLIQYDGKKVDDDAPKFKFKVNIPDYIQENIEKYRKEFEKYVRIHNNTSNKDVWKVYDHVTHDIFDDVFGEV